MAQVHSVPAGIGRAFRRLGWPLLRLATAVTVLWFLWRQLGSAPFKDGLRAVTWPAIVAAVTLTALTTVCSAWRWRVAAQALGMGIGLPAAVVTVVVLLTLTSPVRPALPYVLAGVAGVAGAAGCAALVARHTDRRGRSRLTRAVRAVADDLRHGILAPHVWPQLALSSVLVVAGHTATFVIAARVAGSTAPLGELLVLLMVVQTATVIPLGIGGWGLREGVAAWAFAAAGLGAATGITITTLYAVLMLIAVAPGAGLLLGDAVRRRRDQGQSGESRRPDPAPRALEVVRD
jgi:uncharacterized membrane protein YbhN (UPF0104 family)